MEILEVYLFLVLIMFIYLFIQFKDVDIFDDGKEKENKIITVLACFFVSLFWCITLPVLAYQAVTGEI